MNNARPIWLAGRPRATDRREPVLDKFTGKVAHAVCVAGRAEVDEAIGAAWDARRAMRDVPLDSRIAALRNVAEMLRRRRDEFAEVMRIEAGKPIGPARAEIDRAVTTFTLCADEAGRLGGERLPIDATAQGRAYTAVTMRVPIGVCSLITPFNFPVNLVAHKIGPAIAAGCPFVLKPDSRTPVSALLLGELLAATDLPPAAWSILPCPDDGRELFTEDDRPALLSFTGSPKVGWELKNKAGRKRVVLELGGNAACIVDEGAAADFAVERIAYGAFAYAGQSCISVQRVFAHRSVYESVRDGLVARAKKFDEQRDPHDESTLFGPVIDTDAAERIETWISEAVAAGARVLTGGSREGAWVSPTVLENTPHDVNVSCNEVFGPVVTIEPFEDFDDAIERADASEWGLQAGVFTPSVDRAELAFARLEVGAVVINDVPTVRLDAAPYGGVKGSGLGREGPRWAIEDMTEIRAMLTRRGFTAEAR